MAAERHPDTPVPPVEDVIRMVERMTPPDRLRVIEAVSRSLREDIAPRESSPTDEGEIPEWKRQLAEDRARILANVPPESSAHRLLGAFRSTEHVPMTPEEERAVVEEYLAEKYGQ